MSFASVAPNPSSNMGTSQANQFANVRSLTYVASDPEKNPKIENFMQQLIDHDLGTETIQRVTKTQARGEFVITMASTLRRDQVKKMIEDAYQAGSLHYKIKNNNLPVSEKYIILTDFPEEMRIEAISAFMTQYVFEPTAEILKHPDFGFEIGELKITHKGLRKPLSRRVWIGPNVSAHIKETSTSTWDNCVPKCSNCLEQGHLHYTCDRPQKCRNCRKGGHVAKNCKKCTCCKKWGHTEEMCFFNPKNKQSTNKTNKISEEKNKNTTTQEEIKERVKEIMENKSDNNSTEKETTDKETTTDEEGSTTVEDEKDDDTLTELTSDESEIESIDEEQSSMETEDELLQTQARGTKRGAKDSPKHGKEKKTKDNTETPSPIST